MARRVFLHVGTPKSGTTFLQSLWWQHHDALSERGLLLPGAGIGDHFRAASLVSERAEVVDRLTEEQRGIWQALLAETGAWPGTALISHELFARADAGQAGRALASLHGVADEVHLVVTARDLARQLPSGWQQRVKAGLTATLEEFWRRTSEDDPGGDFWLFQDVPALLGRWTGGLSADRAHLVVLPQPGAPRDRLWRQTCDLMGVDPAGLDVEPRRSNESLGIAEVEVMRRLHASLPADRRDIETTRLAAGFFTRQVLVPSGTGEAFVLPRQIHAWAVERSRAMVEQLRTTEYDVVGDLGDLVPPASPPEGRTPDEVTDSEVAEVAVSALGRSLLHERDRRHRDSRSRGRPQGRRRDQ